MTRDDIMKKLIYNQNQIGNIRTTINEQESQIENLEGLRNSFNRLLYDFFRNYICLFNYLFISSQMSAKPYFIGSTGILPLW